MKSVGDRWGYWDANGYRPRYCSECPRALKDHTGPMTDECTAAKAKRLGFTKWRDALAAIGESIKL